VNASAPARRRIYLMRHAQVRYFRGEHHHDVLLTEAGHLQAAAAAEALREVSFDRVITSGLPRTIETARAIAPYAKLEEKPALREIESGELRGVAPEVVQEMMTAAFRGIVPLDTRFLGGETIGELLDRIIPALDALLEDESWDVMLLVLHGAVNRAILSHALTGERTFFGAFEQAPACINVLDVDREGSFIVRAVGYTPYDPAHVRAARQTTMEQLWQEYLDARGRNP
jgi:probable phosphoglycerate mutase